MDSNLIYIPHGKHSFYYEDTVFIVDKKYKYIQPFRKGIISVYCKVKNTENGNFVVIRKVQNAYNDLFYSKCIAREIKFLKHFKHDKIVSLLDVIKPNNPTGDEDIYMVFDFMEGNLQYVLNYGQLITDEHIQYVVYQILCGLVYIHSANLIHTNLKPKNILVNTNCELKICGFNLARGLNDQGSIKEQYVSRWYCAPEIILNGSDYNQSVDIWSVGCIIAQLLRRTHLFNISHYLCGQATIYNLDKCVDWIHGDERIHILNVITILGYPSKEDMSHIKNKDGLYFMSVMPIKTKQPWQKLYPDANPKILDLLDKMLTFNPKQRLTAKECLEHPYFNSLRCPDDELEFKQAINWEEEQFKPTKEILQKKIYQESLFFNPN